MGTESVNGTIELAIYLVAGVLAFFLFIKAVKEIIRLIDQARKDKYVRTSKSNYIELQTAVRNAESVSESSEYRKVQGFPVKLIVDIQNRYVPGRDAYENAKGEGNMRSVVFGDAEALQKLLDEKAGTGEFVTTNKEKVNFKQSLGQYVDPVAQTKVMTTIGIIHYTPEGAYIVPARPVTEDNING